MSDESLTEFLIRAESVAAGLRAAGETVSDSLIISMIMKGLPDRYSTFCTLILHSEREYTLAEFKTSIANHDSAKTPSSDSSTAMAVGRKSKGKSKGKQKTSDKPTQGQGSGDKRFCNYCKRPGHIEEKCFKKRKEVVNNVADNNSDVPGGQNDNFFTFYHVLHDTAFTSSSSTSVMVDTRASSHIICDSSFILKDYGAVDQSHTIELANGKRLSGIVKSRVDATFPVVDSTGKKSIIGLRDALYIPDFKMNILSVTKLVHRGGCAAFAQDDCYLKMKNGNKFPLSRFGNLFYLKTHKDSVNAVNTLEDWHRIFGHLNEQDLKKMPSYV
jgi:hypothetical protein